MENLPVEIFDLIEKKSFEELTAPQRGLVLEYFSQSEYTSQRAVILAFKSVDGDLVFQPKEASSTLETQSLLQKIFTHPVPLYQIAAGLALFFMINYAIANDYNTKVAPMAQEVKGHSVSDGYYPDSLVFVL